MNQRWRKRRDSYRPNGEYINTRLFEVASIGDDNTAKGFVIEHHYSASFPSARFRFGLYHQGELAGVAVFSHPCNEASLACMPGERLAKVELGRFVLLDFVPANGETWFLGRCFSQLKRQGLTGIMSFSDPEPRFNGLGECIFGGHIGTIYQAHNACYVGRARAKTMQLLPDGTSLHRRSISKLKNGERGWRHVAEKLIAQGAVASELKRLGREAWAERWLSRLVEKRRHPGNHKYLWGLDRSTRKALPKSLPYPKCRWLD